VKKLNLDEQLLRKLYNEDLMSIKDIAKELNVGLNTVKRYFERYGIERRNIKEATIIALSKKEKKITELICPICKKKFFIKNSLLDRADKHFCSTKCSSKYYAPINSVKRKNGKCVKCHICGKSHYRRKKLLYKDNKHFCSKNCFVKYQSTLVGVKNPKYNRKSVHCSNCGKKIERTNYQVNRNKKHHYCSRECMSKHYIGLVYGENHPSWKGGGDLYYGHDWPRISKSIIERDNHTCQRCKIKEEELPQNWRLQVHHKKPLRNCSSLEEANNPENLITLCNRCHGIVEQNGIDF